MNSNTSGEVGRVSRSAFSRLYGIMFEANMNPGEKDTRGNSSYRFEVSKSESTVSICGAYMLH